ncbi:MAG TPA: hypothetical protein VNG13_10190 [Mycobacteriales bacterium]|nr:hypothetical protein [Mycobacteriales bacterium]
MSGVHGPDFPAQQFRVWLFSQHRALLFDNQWFSGHLLPGYSMLFPPLAATVGSAVVGIASCVGSSWLATRIVRVDRQQSHTVGLLWFSVIIVADLVIGRLPFALGLTFGLAALLAVQRRRPGLVLLAAAACSLASPLAAGFLLLAAVAWVPSIGLRRAAPLGGAGVGLAVAQMFGGGGRFPFPWSSLLAILLFVAVGLAICPSRYPTLRRGLALYGGAALLLFVFPNPIGGNLTRLGTLLAGPVAALVLLHIGRRRALVVLTAPLLFWQLQPVYGALASSVGDPSAEPAYYAGLFGFLRTHDTSLGRIEIPLTRNHWETSYVATAWPLARGWERQLDTGYNAVLYQPGLTSDAYHRWLQANGVSYVALPDVALDASSAQEWRIVITPEPWLRPVWHDAHWQVWAVRDTSPMITGDATLVDVGVTSFGLYFAHPGAAVVRLHYTRFWRVTDGYGCVAPDPSGWTIVRSALPGPVTVTARLDLIPPTCTLS